MHEARAGREEAMHRCAEAEGEVALLTQALRALAEHAEKTSQSAEEAERTHSAALRRLSGFAHRLKFAQERLKVSSADPPPPSPPQGFSCFATAYHMPCAGTSQRRNPASD